LSEGDVQLPKLFRQTVHSVGPAVAKQQSPPSFFNILVRCYSCTMLSVSRPQRTAAVTRAALSYWARIYDSAICRSKMSIFDNFAAANSW